MKQVIYVYLVGEGTDVWRPVEAEHEQGDVFRIVSENHSAGDEVWEFQTGDRVRCQERIFSDGQSALAAVSKA